MERESAQPSDLPEFAPQSPAQSRTDLAAAAALIRRRLWLIVTLMAVIMGSVLAVVLLLQPRYTAEALVLIDPRPGQAADVESLLAGRSPDTATIESQVQIMRSRLLAARAIMALDLLNDPEFNRTNVETISLSVDAIWSLFPEADAATPPSPKDRTAALYQRLGQAPVPALHPARGQTAAAAEPASSKKAPPAVKTVTPGPTPEPVIQEKPKKLASVQTPSAVPVNAPQPQTAAAPPVAEPAAEDPIPAAVANSPEMEQALKTFAERLHVQRRGLSYAVAIGFTSEDPEKAARIANKIAELYILDQVQSKLTASQWTGEWLSEKISQLQNQVLHAENAIENYRVENNLLNTKGLNLLEQQMAEVNAQLVAARADHFVKKAKSKRVQQLIRRGSNLDALQEVLSSRTIAGLRQDESRLAAREAELTTRYNDNYPDLIDVRAEIGKVRQQIRNEVERIANSFRNEAAAAAEREASLLENLRALEADTVISNRAQVKLRELERIAQASREQYQVYLARFQQIEGQEGGERAEARLITEAGIPVSPSYPKKKLMLAGGFGFALVFALIMAFIVDLSDLRLYTSWQVERYLGAGMLGIVPRLSGGEGARDMAVELAREQPNTHFSEAVRNIRRHLPLAKMSTQGSVFLLTSALPNEGKTTTSAALAYSIARAGLDVVVIDSDLRRPSLSKLFRLDDQIGLMDLLSGNAALSECLHPDGRTGSDPSRAKSESAGRLHIMPIGRYLQRDIDTLTAEQMSPIMLRLKANYDVVLMDSAPVLAASDAQLLATLADGTVMVVRWGNTPRDAVIPALKLLQHGTLLGVVLAGVDMKRVKRYGFGDASYYFNRYSAYYGYDSA